MATNVPAGARATPGTAAARGDGMSTTNRILLVALTAAILVPTAGASAQLRLYGDGQLGLLGEARFQNGNTEVSDSLEPSGGGVLGIDATIFPVLSLGAEMGFMVWNTDGGDDFEIDPNGLVYASFVPRLRIPLGPSALYLMGQLGPSFGFTSDDVTDGLRLVGSRAETGIGMHAGLLAGAQIMFGDHVGIDLAAGYQHHVLWHELRGPLTEGSMRVDLGQLLIRAGLVIGF